MKELHQLSGAAVLLCWLLPAAAVSAAPQAGAGGSSRPSLGALAGSLAALDSCLRGADRHQIAASRSAGRARRFAGVELQRWHLRLRATEEIDFGWLDGCRRAGLVLGPPVELTSSGKGQTLQAVAWTVRVVAGGEPARPEAARQLETNLAWLRRLAKDSRPLLAMFAALATTDTVRLERARLSRRRLQLWGLVPNAAARTVLAEKLAGLARHLSWPLAVEVEGMRAGVDDFRYLEALQRLIARLPARSAGKFRKRLDDLRTDVQRYRGFVSADKPAPPEVPFPTGPVTGYDACRLRLILAALEAREETGASR